MLRVSAAVFPYFETEFDINSLFLYKSHIECDKTTHSITKPVIKTKWTVQTTWNKMKTIANGIHALCPRFRNFLKKPHILFAKKEQSPDNIKWQLEKKTASNRDKKL